MRGAGSRRWERAAFVVVADLALQLLLVVLGLALLFEPDVLTDPAQIAGTPDAEDAAVRVHDRDRGVLGPRRVVGARRRGRRVAPRAQAPARRPDRRGGAVHRHRARRLLDAAADRRPLARGADARHRVGVRAGVAARAAALRDRGLGRRDPGDRVQRRHVRALAAGLLARAQPPDPVARRPPAPALRHAGRADRARRAAGDRARAARRPGDARRDLRVRRHAGVHDRPPGGDPAALPRARSRPAVQDPARRPRGPRRAAAHRGAGRGDGRRGVRLRARAARRGALRRRRLDGVRRRALRHVPHDRGQARLQAHHGPGDGTDAPRGPGGVRLDPGAGARHAARRRHRADRRAPGCRGERGRRRGRRGDRGALGVRDPDGAAARHAACRTAS